MTHKYKVVPLGTTHYEFDSPTRGAGYMKLEVLPSYDNKAQRETQWLFWSNELNKWVHDAEAEQRHVNMLFRSIENF